MRCKKREMESYIGRKDNPADRRLCKDCKEFIDGKCSFLGNIKYTDLYNCSFYKGKNENKIKNL